MMQPDHIYQSCLEHIDEFDDMDELDGYDEQDSSTWT